MLKFVERKNFKTVDDAIKEIALEFELLSISLDRLELIFLDVDWALRESQQDSIKLFLETQQSVLIRLSNIETAIICLNKFLKEKPSSKIDRKKGLGAINKWVGEIHSKIADYDKRVKGKNMPTFHNEISRIKKHITSINKILGKCNEIIVPIGKKPYPFIADPFK